MKNRKILMYVTIILLILFILGVGILIIKNSEEKSKIIEDYTPVEEITEGQLRQTSIILYFYDVNKGILGTEVRKIDAKELLEDPEKKLIEYLIQGPCNDNLLKIIPENTKLISVEKIKGILYINFSDGFIYDQNLGLDQEKIIIDSILKTVTQLNEINGIKILINGEENKSFPDGEINFKDIFKIDNN